jgi:DNA polymerase-3 subunit delta
VEGSKILAQLAAKPTPDFLILVITGGLDWAERKAAWVKAFDDSAVFVEIEQVAVEKLPAWIAQRLVRQGLEPEEGAAELLAERCEGNLVSAHQEIARLALVLGATPAAPQSLSVDAVAESVARSDRFTLLQLGEAALAGEPERALRVLEGLRGEGEEPTLVLWTLAEEVRAVLQFNPNGDRGGPMRTWRGGPRRQRALAQAARRLGRERARLYQMLQFAGQTDLIVKGVRPGDTWGAFAQLTAALAGAPISLPVATGLRSTGGA